MNYYCNPVNVNYRYQFNKSRESGETIQINREAADPSMICFEGRYYVFASMTLGVWVSDDLVHWENHKLPEGLPVYDYAPDVRVMNGYVYLAASSHTKNCDHWRTKDVLNGPYERIEGTFPFWDPNMFVDDDGRVYFYWGCSNATPIYGVELDPETLLPLTERVELVFGAPDRIGYERVGEDNSISPATEEEVERAMEAFLTRSGTPLSAVPEHLRPMIRGMFTNMPYIEGAWVDKHCGKYYLQYACPGTQYNTYSDGVYVPDKPLGPFTLAENNPFSYKPGGFIPGAGHGSTMQDEQGNWWHIATMRISMNHNFERRVGLWPAGFDEDGELYCNQRYGDWPMTLSGFRQDAWRDPAWMLLSAGKSVTASSFVPGNEPEKAAEENVQTWWRAASNSREEWLCLDLGGTYEVHAVQVNFADDRISIPTPGEMVGDMTGARYIDGSEMFTQWKLEASEDGESWFLISDKSEAKTDLSHDFLVCEEGYRARFFRLSEMAVPYAQNPCISGLRIFGLGQKEAPQKAAFTAVRTGTLDMEVTIEPQENTVGYNILFGSSPEKLYHSYMVFEPGTKRVGALVEGRDYVVRVDSFNESGITEGTVKAL